MKAKLSKPSTYQEHGYENREDYLRSLADDYDMDTSMVFELASVLGESEDFDGLITTLEDYAYSY